MQYGNFEFKIQQFIRLSLVFKLSRKALSKFSFEVKDSSWGIKSGWFDFNIQKIRPELYKDITKMLSPFNASVTSFSLRVHQEYHSNRVLKKCIWHNLLFQ